MNGWLVVWNIWIIFPCIGNHHPNWQTHIFRRGRYTTNQSLVGAKQLLYFQPWKWDDDPDLRRFFSAPWQKNNQLITMLWFHFFKATISVVVGNIPFSVGLNHQHRRSLRFPEHLWYLWTSYCKQNWFFARWCRCKDLHLLLGAGPLGARWSWYAQMFIGQVSH